MALLLCSRGKVVKLLCYANLFHDHENTALDTTFFLYYCAIPMVTDNYWRQETMRYQVPSIQTHALLELNCADDMKVL